jgi:ATP-dependent Clp endopeptidase proteolytic subunit ClpP
MEEIDDEVQIMLPYNLIQITGDITEETAQKVTEELLTFDYNNQILGNDQPIHMIINSGGGIVVAAWQICDIMDSIKTSVHTIGLGNISSAALVIFLNGEKGHRILSRRTSVMSHQYSWGVAGKYEDLKAANSEIDNLYKRMIDFYIEKTGLDKQTISEKLLKSSDMWFTASQAKKYKLVDKVYDFKKNSPFSIIKKLQPSEQRKMILEAEKEAELIQQQIQEVAEENEKLREELNKKDDYL